MHRAITSEKTFVFSSKEALRKDPLMGSLADHYVKERPLNNDQLREVISRSLVAGNLNPDHVNELFAMNPDMPWVFPFSNSVLTT